MPYRVGVPELVEDGATGLLVPPKDPLALAAALERLRNEPATRERLARAARETAIRRFTWDEAARRYEEGYAQAAALDAR
mgnify:CR=1 FL=1